MRAHRIFTLLAFALPLAVAHAAPTRPFSPGILIFNADPGGLPQRQTVALNIGVGSATASDSCGPWVSYYSAVSKSLTVEVVPTVAGPGSHACMISVTRDGASLGTLPIILNVGVSGGSVTGVAAPASMTFAWSGFRVPLPQTLTVDAAGDFYVGVTYPNDNGVLPGDAAASFLTATPSSSTGPATVTIGINSQLLGDNSYKATIYLETSAGIQLVPVDVLASNRPVLMALQPTINLSYRAGEPPYNTSLTIAASDEKTSLPLTLTSPAKWVVLKNCDSGATPVTCGVNIDPSGLPNGLNTAAITVTSYGFPNSPLVVPVVVLVSGSSVTATVTPGKSSLTFLAALNGARPPWQQLTIGSAAAVNYTATATTQNGNSTWLGISPSGSLNTGTSPSLTVSVNQDGLPEGTYSGNISLIAGGMSQTVPVKLAVSAGGNVTVTPTSLDFVYTSGGSAPAPQQYTIKAAAGTAAIAAGLAVTTQSGGDWLSPGSASGIVNAGMTLSASVFPGSLAAGLYRGSIVLTPVGGAQVTIPVTLTVRSLAISASPAALVFPYRVGGQSPDAQAVQVSGASGLAFAASASSDGGWLSVTPSSGTLGAGTTSVSVAANPANLGAGSYDGTVTVAGTNGATGSITINVKLNVTAPLPTITTIASSASYADSAMAAGEIVSVFGGNLGPLAGMPLALDPSGKVAATLGGVQVLIGGYPAPILYASDTQVTAVVPYEIAQPFIARPAILVKYLGQSSNAITLAQTDAVPGIFTADSSGKGQGAILNSDYTPNDAKHPAARGEIVQIFVTGEGQTYPAGVSGRITSISTTGPLTPQPLLPLEVTVDGQAAVVQFYGEAPSMVAGLMQVNVQIPLDTKPGEVPVVVSLGTRLSQPGVTVSVR